MASLEQSNSGSQSSSRPVMNPGARGMYKQLLRLNTQNYNRILDAHRQGQQQLSNNLGNVYGGYANLQNQAMHMLGVDGGGWGVATPAAQAIAQGFARQQGVTQQNAVNRGLGNTTVLQGLSQANQLNAAQAYGGLGSQLAQTATGTYTDIGKAGLGAQMQGAGMQAHLGEAYMGDLAGYQFKNTFGDLYGNASNSSSHGSSQGQSASGMSGGGMGGMPPMTTGNGLGGGGGAFSSGGDISPFDYGANRGGGNSPFLSGGPSSQLDLSGNYAGSFGEPGPGGGSFGGFAGQVA